MSLTRAGRILSVVAGLGSWAFAGSEAVAAAPDAASAHGQWKLVEDYCFKCHNTEDWAGSVAFDTMSIADVPQDGKVWEAAIKKLKSGLMPPPGQKQPDRKDVTSYLQ